MGRHGISGMSYIMALCLGVSESLGFQNSYFKVENHDDIIYFELSTLGIPNSSETECREYREPLDLRNKNCIVDPGFLGSSQPFQRYGGIMPYVDVLSSRLGWDQYISVYYISVYGNSIWNGFLPPQPDHSNWQDNLLSRISFNSAAGIFAADAPKKTTSTPQKWVWKWPQPLRGGL